MTPVDLIAVVGIALFVIIVNVSMGIVFLRQSQSDN